MVGADAFPPPSCRSFASTAAFSEADSTTGVIGRWIHQTVMAIVATITSSKAASAPHPYSNHRDLGATGAGAVGEGGESGAGEEGALGDIG